MIDAAAAGDEEAGRAAEAARNEKIELLGLDEEEISYDDLALLAKVIHPEAGSAWLSMEWKHISRDLSKRLALRSIALVKTVMSIIPFSFSSW